METKKDFEHGIVLYYDKKFAESCVAFKVVLAQAPSDVIAQLYLKNAANMLLNDLEENWSGFIATQKTGLF